MEETKTIGGIMEVNELVNQIIMFSGEEHLVANIFKSRQDFYLSGLDLRTNRSLCLRLTPENLQKIKILKEKSKEKRTKFYLEYPEMIKSIPNLGTDPEIFVVDKTTNEVIPAFAFLPSKKEKFERTVEYPGVVGNVYWDGFQAEGTPNANTCISFVTDNIRCFLNEVLNRAKKVNPNATLSLDSLREIPIEKILSEKEEYVQFGCMPSYNVYDLKGMPLDGRQTGLRSCGGHIHFGYQMTPETITSSVKALDAILGVISVSLFGKLDSPRRREMYGLAGEYRTPPHGLEYRTLSNAWLCHPSITHLIFELARISFSIGSKDLLDVFWTYKENEVIEIIQQCDVSKAKNLLEKNLSNLEKIFSLCGFYKEKTDLAIKGILNGVETIIKNPRDLVSNWKLDGHWESHSDQDKRDFNALTRKVCE